jgi:vacuolar protein sorting-associated protein 35
VDEEDFQEEQNLVARLVHMLVNDDPEQMFQILTTARKHFALGGPRRLQYTLPPLVFEALKLVRSLQAQDLPEEGEGSGSVSLKKVFQFLHQTVEALAMIPAAELSLRLYLQCAEAAGDCGLEPVAYEFFTQAFVLYEEEISDSKAQVTALQLIIGTLQRTRVFGVENRDTLTHKATGVSWDFFYWSSVVGILYLSYVVEWPWISS